jgi:hypothetical protein
MSNEAALRRFHEKQEKQEISLELMFAMLDTRLSDLRLEINKLQQVARNYDNFDFEEELNDSIREML